ncbi:TolC family protein [Leeuwenhoekiella sp. LLG6367-2.1]|uniref:TolC family protein n=1 Tax=Leeuwenhoekiella sp. LLG6367-2.1 TaxID=3160833 RepID=UPI00386772DA
MINRLNLIYTGVVVLLLSFSACKAPGLIERDVEINLPETYSATTNTVQTTLVNWKDYFTDPYLGVLIDTALQNNQELNIMLQEISISKAEIKARKGEYLPFVGFGAAAETEKVGRYTSQGANDANTEIKDGVEFPEPLPNYRFGLQASWELDIWGKLRNSKKAAVLNYLSSLEGRNFMVTQLVGELAESYYELMALDNQLEIVNRNIEIRNNAFEIIKLQKEAARVTGLAVSRFEAEVLHTKSLQFDIQQRIIETENRINFLVGRFPQKVARSTTKLVDLNPVTITSGIPAQLLENRTDVKQAELALSAAKLDVKVAKARFYPSLGISAGIGYEAFNPKYLLNSPESLLYSIAGELTAPLLNRNEIKAAYMTANAKQIQAVFDYEKTVLNAYIEVANQLSKVDNLAKSYALKAQEVDALNRSVEISNKLFRSARADYMEVLMTQRDALDSNFDLIETKMDQMNAYVHMYQALGGGWN